MAKDHIRKVHEAGTSVYVTSLCGLSHNLKHMVHPSQATCERCLSIYTDNSKTETMRKERLKKEVRTTSSTGGQKGVKEAQYSLIPAKPLEELAVLFGRGARKYASHQWRQGYEWTKSMDAIQRHYAAFAMGLDYDVCSNDPDGCQHVDSDGEPFEGPEEDTCYNHTGAHHMTAVAWHSFVLLEFKDTCPEHDDRYILGRVDEIVFTADTTIKE